MQKIRCAGFGGQGIVLMGRLISYSAMVEDKHTTFFPQYGAAMRGGTASCSVIVSDKDIAAPTVDEPDVILIMNGPSLDKFEPLVKPGGWIFYNTSLIEREIARDDVNVVKVPANELAEEVGSARAANMIMLGAFAGKLGSIELDTIKATSLAAQMHGKSDSVMELNRKALDRGAALVA